MTATSDTWRNMQQLHRIFAASGVVLLIATVWMLMADHRRQWKSIQRTTDRLQIRQDNWRQIQFRSQEHQVRHRTLLDALEKARRTPIDLTLLEGFEREWTARRDGSDPRLESIQARARQLEAMTDAASATKLRSQVLDQLRDRVQRVRVQEERLERDARFAVAARDAAVAELTLLVRDGRPAAEQRGQQELVNRLQAAVETIGRRLEDLAGHRRRLEVWLGQITAAEDRAAEEVEKSLAERRQLQTAVEQRRSSYVSWYGYLPLPGKKLLELPLFDAFNSPRKIETIWSADLEIDYSLVQVPRYDRCTTCHQLIDKTVAGGTNQPAYPPEQRDLEFALAAPAGGTPHDGATGGASPAERLSQNWGLHLAEDDLLRPGELLVQYVWPDSPAARAARRNPLVEGTANGRAIRESLLQLSSQQPVETNPPLGLVMGDVIVGINGQRATSLAGAQQELLQAAEAGESLLLCVRRGVPAPYASHPRIDLFVGATSPHPMSTFGCTVCHEGQGSGTEFRWASHTPDSEAERRQWQKAHGWFDNPDWPYPMLSQRFAESACLKCHHDVVDLEPTDRFSAPPAPKVVRGYHLIRNYGCFGCHELQGFRGLQRVGPDLRPEPNFASLALQLQADPGFQAWEETSQTLVGELIQNPHRAEPFRRIAALLQADAASADPVLGPDTHQRLTPLWKEQPHSGTLRRVGTSLRCVATKLQPPFLYEWIASPRSMRPTTRMPHSFGLWDHLDDQGRAAAQTFEPLEILSMVTYLVGRSEAFNYLVPEVAESPSIAAVKAARGKVVFQERGCLACHTHRDFPDADAYRPADEIVQGPDLSDLADKLAHEEGRRWLYSWIRQPTRYHPRTLMPQTFLDPVKHADGTVTDPVDDVAEYLLANSESTWQPAPQTLAVLGPLDPGRQQALDGLTVENLRDTFAPSMAEEYAANGIPADVLRGTLGAEAELARPRGAAAGSFAVSTDQQLRYVGRKSLARYGCVACHDIPGLEDAKPIGPALSDWGRKDERQLAFESVVPYLAGTRSDGRPRSAEIPGFYLLQIRAGHRAGFAYQKIREPRSYDFRRAENKRYTERLRMPQFQFSDADREAIITFLLGLVANPPAERYVYEPNAGHRAWIDGQRVLDQYRCQTCHVVAAQKWQVAFRPGECGPQPQVPRYPFLNTQFPTEMLDASKAPDASGLARAVVQGLPTLDMDGLPLVLDEDGLPLDDAEPYDRAGLEYPLDLWQPAAVDGHVYAVGVLPLSVRADVLENVRAPRGGFLAKYLLPHVVKREQQNNPSAKGSEAWGWLPPPLLHEGRKVQSGWLHDFLLNPTVIRPAAVMRMPRYNLSPDETAVLVRYFAMLDGAEYPYEFRSRRQADYLASAEQRYRAQLPAGSDPNSAEARTRLGDAWRIVTDANYCIKCHRVADYEPQTADRAKAPDLAQVYLRLRPEYVRDWIADPKAILPYTGMPVNIPYDPAREDLGAISQELYLGSSIEQLEALVDLLMNFDHHALQRTSIGP